MSPIGDITQLVFDLGHDLVENDFGDDFSATCMTINGIKFTIALNTSQMWNENFRRFTVAHELGHISLVQHHAEMIRNGGLLKSKAEFQSNSVIEREADKFAINFLAPVGLFKKEIENLELTYSSLSNLGNIFGISLLSCAFRFVELTDLCCSLIIFDGSTQKIKYEIRSGLMKQYNKHPYLQGWYAPEQGSVTRLLAKPLGYDINDQIVELNEYYQNMRVSIRCNESVFKLGYNNTVMVLLSALDDPEDLI